MSRNLKRTPFFAPVMGARFDEVSGKTGDAPQLLPIFSELALPLRLYKRSAPPPPPATAAPGGARAPEPEDYFIMGDATKKNEFRGMEEPRLPTVNPFKDSHYIVVYEDDAGGGDGGGGGEASTPSLCVLPLAGWMNFRLETAKDKLLASRVPEEVFKEEQATLEALKEASETKLRPAAQRELKRAFVEGGAVSKLMQDKLLEEEGEAAYGGGGGGGAGGGGGGGGGGAKRRRDVVSFREGHGDSGVAGFSEVAERQAAGLGEGDLGYDGAELHFMGGEEDADFGEQGLLYGDDDAVQEEDYMAAEQADEIDEGRALLDEATFSWIEDNKEVGEGAEVEDEAEADEKPNAAKRSRLDREDPQAYFRKEIPSFIVADGGQTNSKKLAKCFKQSGFTDETSKRIFQELVSELCNKDKQIDGSIVFSLKTRK